MTQLKQRLLYLHSTSPDVFSNIIALNLVEPTKNATREITAEDPDWPYQTVHDAIVDGWQIVQFPYLQAPFDDRELDVLGYEFILQKMEMIDE